MPPGSPLRNQISLPLDSPAARPLDLLIPLGDMRRQCLAHELLEPARELDLAKPS